MPSKNKPHDCPHTILIKKAFTLDAGERQSALARGLPTPHQILVLFCCECWTVNPRPKVSQ